MSTPHCNSRLLFRFLFPTLLLLMLGLPAHAIEFRTINAHGTPFYAQPDVKSKKLCTVSRGYPVEIQFETQNWMKIRDAAGMLAWVEKKSLSPQHNVVVTAPKAEVRAAADTKSALLFVADKDVIMELLDTDKAGWVHVLHRDGLVGYMRIQDIWGI